MRCSVMRCIRSSTGSAPVQVSTSACMIDETGSSRSSGPSSARRRTTSRSDTIPSTVVPSAETTRAPTLAVPSCSTAARTGDVRCDGGDVPSLAVEDLVGLHPEHPRSRSAGPDNAHTTGRRALGTPTVTPPMTTVQGRTCQERTRPSRTYGIRLRRRPRPPRHPRPGRRAPPGRPARRAPPPSPARRGRGPPRPAPRCSGRSGRATLEVVVDEVVEEQPVRHRPIMGDPSGGRERDDADDGEGHGAETAQHAGAHPSAERSAGEHRQRGGREHGGEGADPHRHGPSIGRQPGRGEHRLVAELGEEERGRTPRATRLGPAAGSSAGLVGRSPGPHREAQEQHPGADGDGAVRQGAAQRGHRR